MSYPSEVKRPDVGFALFLRSRQPNGADEFALLDVAQYSRWIKERCR
jgi:hypothetical protein